MDRPKWHSKLIHMAVVLAVVMSLVGAALMPVAAQGPMLEVTVTTDADPICYCNDFTVFATITNNGNETAANVTANITWSPVSGAHNVSGSTLQDVGDISAVSSVTVNWTMHCDEPGALNITVNASETRFARPGVSATGWTVVTQYKLAQLTAEILTPEDHATFTMCHTFPLVFTITNNGTAPAEWVSGTIYPSANINVINKKGESLPCGMAYTTSALPLLLPGETYTWNVTMHCCDCDEPPLESSIHVVPNGNGYCTGTEIEEEYTYSDIIHVRQTYDVSCNVTPNPSKVCHNVTFAAIVGECAELPLNGTVDWDDGMVSEFGSGTRELVFSHHYNISGNYTVVINVTDALNVTGTCNTTVEVFPPLTAACNVTPYNVTKLDDMCSHNLTFEGTGVGGFPNDICNYTWTWDFGDNSTVEYGNSKASPPTSHCYNETGIFIAVFTVTDDCMNNTANCSIPIKVFPPLNVTCNVTSNVTKIGHNVTFCGEAIDGIPNNYPTMMEPCTYNWTWTFYKDGIPYPSLNDSGSGNPGCTTPQFTEPGIYTGVFFTEDTCWGNNVSCNKTIEVFPGLNLTCEGNDSTICNAVNFTATLTGGVPNSTFNWTWDFGDPYSTKNTAHTQNASHVYMCTGNYTATVTVCDDLDPINCANCSVNVSITIEPPELIYPRNGSTVAVGCNNTVCLEWEDIGCCNYTVLIWKEALGEKVHTIHTGKNNTACVELFEIEAGWYWQVIAQGTCWNDMVNSTIGHFDVDYHCEHPAVVVTYPNGGETLTCNTTRVITWYASDQFGNQNNLTIDIYYSVNGGAWIPIAMGEENDGAYGWMVPDGVNSDQCLVLIVAIDTLGNEGNDVSNGPFTIECAPAPTTCTALYTGWNLYATPLIPDNTDIANVTAGISGVVISIQTYNASSGEWLWYVPGNPASTLTVIKDGVGYWIFTNSTATLCIVGQPLPDPPALPPTYAVVPGWNLIGFKSMTPKHHSVYLLNLWSGGIPNYSALLGYDGSAAAWIIVYPGGVSGMMEPGHGFWLFATAAGTIVPTL